MQTDKQGNGEKSKQSIEPTRRRHRGSSGKIQFCVEASCGTAQRDETIRESGSRNTVPFLSCLLLLAFQALKQRTNGIRIIPEAKIRIKHDGEKATGIQEAVFEVEHGLLSDKL